MSSDLNNHNHDHNHNANSNSNNTNHNRRRRRSSSVVAGGQENINPRKKQKKSTAHQGRDLQEKRHPLVQKRVQEFPNQSLQDEGNGKVYCQACNKSIGAEISTVKRHLGKLHLYFPMSNVCECLNI